MLSCTITGLVRKRFLNDASNYVVPDVAVSGGCPHFVRSGVVMKITIAIDCDNEAFSGYPGAEIARILKVITKDLEDVGELEPDSWKLRDHNGNTVGNVVIS